MPRASADQSELLICHSGFNFDSGDQQVYVHPGALVRSSCWIVAGHEQFLAPLTLVVEEFGGETAFNVDDG